MWTLSLCLLVQSFISCVSFDGSHMTTGLAASDGVCLFVAGRDGDTRHMSHPGGGDTRQMSHPGGGDTRQMSHPGGGDTRQMSHPGGGDTRHMSHPGGGDTRKMSHPEGLNSTHWPLGRGEFGSTDHDVIGFTVFEKDVIIPSSDVMINVDILHDLPVFLELHESGDPETFTVRVEAGIKGSDRAEHGLMFDFIVTSLGLVTTVKVHLRYSNDGYHPLKLDTSWIQDTWITWILLLGIWIIGYMGYKKFWKHDNRSTYKGLTSQLPTPQDRILHTPEVGGQVLKCMDVCPTGSGQDRAKQNGNGTCQREETRERKGDNTKNAKQGLISPQTRREVENLNSAERDTMTKVPGQVTFDPDDLTNERSDQTSQRVTLTPGRQWKGRRCLRVVPLLAFSSLLLVSVALGLSRLKVKPTVHVTFPSSNIIRQVRMFSQFPDLSELSKNHSSLSLVSRLQLLGKP
ncbi:uncharacterized protein LOC131954800 [Physella acuta]|uniref:uncharacterized protein LOC131954800 n=1 Tax=Physella acuta TaxID=109671 RepID=UPI0027DD0CA3|nr:uncharacterized protein LOC131954800 [Physella acuta]